MPTITLSTDNHFSWRRVLSCWDYYRPQLQLQLWLWPAIVAAVFTAAILLMLVPVPALSIVSVSSVSWLVTFAPLMLLRSRAAVVDTLLPVKVSERVTFLLIYFFIIIPAVVYVAVAAMSAIAWLIVGYSDMRTMIAPLIIKVELIHSAADYPRVYGIALGSNMMEIMGCLLGVVAFRDHRAIKAIALSIGTGFLLGLISGIIIAIVAVNDIVAFSDSPAYASDELATSHIVDMLTNDPLISLAVTLVVISAWIITFAELAWMVCRLKRRQL